MLSEGTSGIDPSSVVLPGRGETATMNLTVVQDSVVFGATLDVMGTPSFHDIEAPVDRGNTIGFSGGVPFADPDPDLSWYMGDLLPDWELDNASAYDGATIATSAGDHAYHLFFMSVDPEGLTSIWATWKGTGNGTATNVTDWGARLFIYDNTSRQWELLDEYDGDLATDQTLEGQPDLQAWHYVNRTLTGEDKLIVMVQSLAGVNTVLVTDAMTLVSTYATYPVPRLDVGGDGMIDWGLGTSAATGELGRISAFADNSTSVTMELPSGGGHNDTAALLIPPGVNIQGAYVDYVPFPTHGERQRQGYSVHAPATGSSGELTITDIPLLSHQRVSQVVLTNAIKHNVTDQVNEGMDEAFPTVLGRTVFNNQSLAQSFKPAYDGPLTGVDIFIHIIVADPGNITLELREVQANAPTGALLATSILKQADFQEESWNHFTFPPVQVQADKSYAFRLHALDANTSSLSGYSIGYDQNQNYTRGTCYLSDSLDGSTGWSHAIFDLAFRTYMDYRVDAADAALLSVLGEPGGLAADRVYFNVSTFDYVDGNWTFQVDNANPFAVTFDWSAWTKYLLFAESPSLDVGGDGTVEWQDYNVSNIRPLDITDGVQRVADMVDWPLTHVDLFGNVFYRVPLNLSSTSEGLLALRNMVVYYNGSVTTTDLAEALNDLKGSYLADAEGNVNITINVSSKNAGTLTVTSVDILYDLPPYSLHFEDVVVPEDAVSEPMPLDTLIFDDHDNNNLDYTVVKESGDANVSFNKTEGDVVTFFGPANWSGAAVFHVVAVDTSNLTYVTNSFNVTIASVADPPIIHGLLEEYVVYFGVEASFPITIEDNDSPPEAMTITTSTPRVWGDPVNGTLSFLYPFSGVPEVVQINISDGEAWSVYNINVTPEESNEPPVIDLPPGLVVTMDAMGELDLRPYAADMESSRDLLVWSVVSSPDDLVVTIEEGHLLKVIPVATVPGDRPVALLCSDPDGNRAYANLTVKLMPEERHPPVILRGPDALPRVVRVDAAGNEDINLALQKYWYDQEDYNQPHLLRWEVESLRPSLFTVELDVNHKMTIRAFETTGAGYFTIRLFDNDGDVSQTESVQVVVKEPAGGTSSWLMFVIAAVILILVVVALMAASRSKDERPGKAEMLEKTKSVPVPPPMVMKERRERPPVAKEKGEAGEGAGEAAEEAPPVRVPGRIEELMVIHESTSLLTQMQGEEGHTLSEEKEDELIEMSTLFAQERFEDTKVGIIKAFKFNGEEVLVGKGRAYFLVARCSGTDFDKVASEMKRSIVNIDVNLAEKIQNWYPGQKVTPLEEELRDLMQAGS